MFEALAPWPNLHSTLGDIRDSALVRAAVQSAKPDLVIHMAALATVGAAYRMPEVAFSTNVMGTVNLMDALLDAPDQPSAILVVTTDKVYEPSDAERPHIETDQLGGTDPYSASKVAQELVAATYRDHFFDATRTRVATARAGNVIGGGDWSENRLIPDLVRAAASGSPLKLRNPHAIRPWQFVLDVLSGYLMHVQALTADFHAPAALNFAPRGETSVTVAHLVDLLNDGDTGWKTDDSAAWPERPTLRLSAEAAFRELGWEPRCPLESAVSWTSDWYDHFARGGNAREFTLSQVEEYLGDA